MDDGKFTNRRQRESLVLINYIPEEVLVMEKEEIFKPGMAFLKRGRGLINRGIIEILKTLHPNERVKYQRMAKESRLVIMPKTHPPKGEVMVNFEALQNLAEKAIGKECNGCEKKDWKECQLRKDLMGTWIESAQEDCQRDCQYKQ